MTNVQNLPRSRLEEILSARVQVFGFVSCPATINLGLVGK